MANSARFELRLSPSELAAWTEAAVANGEGVAEWIRRQCNHSITHPIFGPADPVVEAVRTTDPPAVPVAHKPTSKKPRKIKGICPRHQRHGYSEPVPHCPDCST